MMRNPLAFGSLPGRPSPLVFVAAFLMLVACSASGCSGESAPTDGKSIAADSTGTKLVVVGSDIWTSDDRGATWTARDQNHAWMSVASDSTGMKLVAVVNGSMHLDRHPDPEVSDGDVWTSTDGGKTWTDQTAGSPAHGQAWVSVASDSTGTYLVAATAKQGALGRGNLWTSSDSGHTWTNQTNSVEAMASQAWAAVASDASGKRLVAVAGAGGIWTSTDAGVTWADRTSGRTDLFGTHQMGWNCVASDASGTKLVAAEDAGDIWTSSDGGANWTNRTASGPPGHQVWNSVASDSTGANLVAVDILVSGQDGDIWTSNDSGATWTNQSDGAAAPRKPWRGVTSDATGSHIAAVGWGAVFAK